MDTYRRHYCPEGKLEFGLLKTESEVANDQLKEIFNVSFIQKQHRNFVRELFYSKSTSIYINNRMLLYETLFKAILA